MNFTSAFARISGAFSGRNDDQAYAAARAKNKTRGTRQDPKQFLL